jgi:hypothetical protein
MTVEAIRGRLYDYIRDADDKKVEAIYTLLEDQIVEPYDWSEDEEFVAELDERVRRAETGIDRTYTMEETKAHLDRLREERAKNR